MVNKTQQGSISLSSLNGEPESVSGLLNSIEKSETVPDQTTISNNLNLRQPAVNQNLNNALYPDLHEKNNFLNFINDFDHTEAKSRCSDQGSTGVLFFTTKNPRLNTFVFKMMNNPREEILGNNFAESLDIHTPKSFVVSFQDISDVELRGVFLKHDKEILSKTANSKEDEFVVLELVKGSSLKELTTESAHFTVAATWQEIGKLLVLDSLIGNYDRFQYLGQNNPGNIMFNGQNKLIAIDQSTLPSLITSNKKIKNKFLQQVKALSLNIYNEKTDMQFWQKIINSVLRKPIDPSRKSFIKRAPPLNQGNLSDEDMSQHIKLGAKAAVDKLSTLDIESVLQSSSLSKERVSELTDFINETKNYLLNRLDKG